MSPSRNAATPRPHLTSLMYSLPVRRLKDILSHVSPGTSLGPVEELPSTQLPRLYKLNMSDDRQLLLSYAPNLAVRLLRQENALVASEAALVYFITESKRKAEIGKSPLGEIKLSKTVSLMDIIPKVLKHSPSNREMAYPYSIFEYKTGTVLSDLSVFLSNPERRIVDKQLASMARALAAFTSPPGTFGTISRVLPETSKASSTAVHGSTTWSEGFNILLEGILRDGEDGQVLLPYEVIRAHYQRFSRYLDAVVIPRLVILDAGSDRNIMVEKGSNDSSPVRLKGLRSWSFGVFGDPLINDAFDSPSEGFLEGWRESGGDDLVEDKDNAEVRLLMYRCYRAVVAIVTEHFRPQSDSSKRELNGRRKLTTVLAELGKQHFVVGEALKRERSITHEAEGCKRPKLGVKVE